MLPRGGRYVDHPSVGWVILKRLPPLIDIVNPLLLLICRHQPHRPLRRRCPGPGGGGVRAGKAALFVQISQQNTHIQAYIRTQKCTIIYKKNNKYIAPNGQYTSQLAPLPILLPLPLTLPPTLLSTIDVNYPLYITTK